MEYWTHQKNVIVYCHCQKKILKINFPDSIWDQLLNELSSNKMLKFFSYKILNNNLQFKKLEE